MIRRMMLASLKNNIYVITPEVAAINTRAITEGFTLPPLSVQHNMGVLINDLKTATLWDKMDCFFNYAFNQVGLGNYSRINWANPAGTMADHFGGLTFTAQGVEGNATDGYILTNYSPVGSTRVTQNSFAKGLALYKASVINPNIMGTREGGQNITNSSSNVQRVNANTTNADNVRDLSGTGIIATHRTINTQIRVYRNSYKSTTNQVSSATNLNRIITFLRASTGYSDAGIGMGYLASYITDAQFDVLRASYNQYLTGIGLTAYA